VCISLSDIMSNTVDAILHANPGWFAETRILSLNSPASGAEIQSRIRVFLDTTWAEEIRDRKRHHNRLCYTPTPPKSQEAWVCGNCQDDDKTGPFTSLDCGHTFHNQCLLWQRNNNCSICRADVSTNIMHKKKELQASTQKRFRPLLRNVLQ